MPDIKISDLTAAGSASGAMQLEVNDSGTSKRITVDQIKSYLLSAGSISATELGTDAVTTIKISNGAVTPAKLSSGAPSWDSSSNVTVGGNLSFSGASQRFKADFSNTTHSSRFIFQTSVANGVSQVGIAPSGTATFTTLDVFNNSDVDNASVGRLRVNTSDVSLNSTITGTGIYLPLTIQTGGAERIRIGTSGQLGIAGANYGDAGQVLTSGGASAAPTWSTPGGGGFSNMQVFESSGTFTVPAGVTKVKVTVVGGGGNGGGSGNTATNVGRTGGGGGGGGAAIEIISGLTPSGTVAVTVGGAGGTSSFGAYCSATGGATGQTGFSGAKGGAGGVGSGGQLNIKGNAGSGGVAGLTTTSGAVAAGSGGSSILGGGAVPMNWGADGSASGSAGGAYGGGGSGGTGNGSSTSGGAGAAGVVIVEY